jgi:hypothetical protein
VEEFQIVGSKVACGVSGFHIVISGLVSWRLGLVLLGLLGLLLRLGLTVQHSFLVNFFRNMYAVSGPIIHVF